MNIKETAGESEFSATVRVEASKATAIIVKRTALMAAGDLEAAIKKAVDLALEPRRFNAEVQKEVNKAMVRLIQSVAEEAILYDDRLRDVLRREVRHIARDAAVERFGNLE